MNTETMKKTIESYFSEDSVILVYFNKFMLALIYMYYISVKYVNAMYNSSYLNDLKKKVVYFMLNFKEYYFYASLKYPPIKDVFNNVTSDYYIQLEITTYQLNYLSTYKPIYSDKQTFDTLRNELLSVESDKYRGVPFIINGYSLSEIGKELVNKYDIVEYYIYGSTLFLHITV